MVVIGDVLSIIDFFSRGGKRKISYEVVDVEEKGFRGGDDDRPQNSPFASGNTALMQVMNVGKEALKKEDISKLIISSQGIEVQGNEYFNKIDDIGIFDVIDIGGISIINITDTSSEFSFRMLNPKDYFFIIINYTPVGNHASFTLRGVIADTKIIDGGKRKRRTFKKLWHWLCSDEKSLKTFLDDNPDMKVS